MRNVYLIAKNILKVTFRKKSNIFVFIVLPVMTLLLSIFLYSSQSSAIKIGVCDKNNGVLSKDFVNSMQTGEKFKIVRLEEKDIKEKIVSKYVDCVLVIPQNFEESILKGNFEKINIVAIKGIDATGWIQSYTDYYMKNLMDIGKASQGDKSKFEDIYKGYKKQNLKLNVINLKDEYTGKAATQQAMGFLVMFILLGATATSGFILKEKRDRTYFRIFASPANNGIYIGGNVLANMIIILIQSIAVVFSATKLFKLDTHIPDLELIFILLCFGLVAVAFGILLVAFSNTTYQASTLSTLIIIPTCMLSGCFWPADIMPDYLQKVSNFLPQTWTLQAISEVQNGKSFSEILSYIAIILAFALTFFMVGVYKMKSNAEIKNFV